MARVGSTSCKTSQLAPHENTWCKVKWNGARTSTSCKTNDMARKENTSSKLKWNDPKGMYFM